jgi:hypothetical protein
MKQNEKKWIIWIFPSGESLEAHVPFFMNNVIQQSVSNEQKPFY